MQPPPTHSAQRLGLGDTRRELRIPVSVSGWVSSSEVHKHRADLVDISVAGCRVLSPFTVAPGRALVIRIGSLAPLLSLVRWSSAGELGLEFTRPLDPRVVRHVSETPVGS